jgi:hypothetical protein
MLEEQPRVFYWGWTNQRSSSSFINYLCTGEQAARETMFGQNLRR